MIKYSLILLIFLVSCDGGLAPINKEDKANLEVKLNFVKGISNWPPLESFKALRVACFTKMPDSNIMHEILSGNAYFNLESLPMYVDTTSVNFEIKIIPTEFKYIAAIQQYDTLITAQKVIGIYSTTGDNTKPSTLLIDKKINYSINIDIDFDNLPPMPF